MDYNLRRLERDWEEQGSSEALERLLAAKSRAEQHLEKPVVLEDFDRSLENSVLFVLAPLEFLSMSYTFSRETYFRAQNYYQRLIDTVWKFQGRVLVLHNSTWRQEALGGFNQEGPERSPHLTSLNRELDSYFSYLSEAAPRKYLIRTDYHREGPFDPNFIEDLFSWEESLPFSGFFFTSGRLDRTLEFILWIRRRIQTLPEVADTPQMLIWDLVYATSPIRSGDYQPLTNQDTWRESQISGYTIGGDSPYLGFDSFQRAIRRRTFGNLGLIHSQSVLL